MTTHPELTFCSISDNRLIDKILYITPAFAVFFPYVTDLDTIAKSELTALPGPNYNHLKMIDPHGLPTARKSAQQEERPVE